MQETLAAVRGAVLSGQHPLTTVATESSIKMKSNDKFTCSGALASFQVFNSPAAGDCHVRQHVEFRSSPSLEKVLLERSVAEVWRTEGRGLGHLRGLTRAN